MREILFRGKTVCDGDWVYGGIAWNPSKKKICIHSDFEEGEVILKTVGQYTGMTDKNGKKIFEGDIIQFIYCFGENREDNVLYIGTVAYHNACFFVCGHSENDLYDQPFALATFMISERVGDIEIIGNVHDNPDRIKACC